MLTGLGFEQWFSSGGLSDQNGEPLVLFHGAKAPQELMSFLPGGPDGASLTGDAYGVAAYFTSSAGEAASYISDAGAVFPVYIRGELLDVDGPLSAEQQERLTQFAADVLLPSDKARFDSGREVIRFQSAVDAREFFDSQMANWKVFGDGMERAKPEVLSSGDEFVIQFTNFDAQVPIRTGEDGFTLFRAIGWDNLPAAGFDGMRMKRDGGASWVVMHRPDGNVKSAIGNSGEFSPHRADIRFSLAEAVPLDNDDAHGQALAETGFWGRSAAGSVVFSKSTGRILLPHRSEGVLEPGTWGTWGGAIDRGEDPAAAARRELVEEAGLDAAVGVEMVPLLVFERGDFRYHNFLAVVEDEFDPVLNWESQDARWVTLDEVPEPLHPGLRALLDDEASIARMRGINATSVKNTEVRTVHRAQSVPMATPESVRAAIAQLVRVGTEDLVEGVGHIVVASSDELPASALAPEQSEAFKSWFGKSKVVDADGKPMVVYHGTSSNSITAFLPHDGEGSNLARSMAMVESFRKLKAENGRMGYMMFRAGSFFSPHPEYAGNYTGEHGGTMYPVYIKAENPVYMDQRTGKVTGTDPTKTPDALIMHDGDTINEVAVIDPAQIKSVLGNCGAYDPSNPDIRYSAPAVGPRAQAWHDGRTNTTVFLADRIAAGREGAVFLHEVVHRHGRKALSQGRWDALVGQVRAWARSGPQSPERAIHDAAQGRVTSSRATGMLADEELFAYAVEEAVAMGIEPSVAAVTGSAQVWLQAVVDSIQRVGERLIGNDLQQLGGQDLVDLAYALAQLDSPAHGLEIRRALSASFADLPAAGEARRTASVGQSQEDSPMLFF